MTSDARSHGKVIVVGNEKGGSGKSTVAISLAIGLLKRERRVATIDLDVGQKTLTRYIENRRLWGAERGTLLPAPDHTLIAQHDGSGADDLGYLIEARLNECDYVVIDTPGHSSPLSAGAYERADIIVTPLNDSFVDLDLLGRVDPRSFKIVGLSDYARFVQEQRLQHVANTGKVVRWLVLRNRLSMMSTRNKRLVGDALVELSQALDFVCLEGFAERLIFREFFPRGLTAMDELDVATLGTRPTMSHASARFEVEQLLAALDLDVAPGESRPAGREAA